MCAVPYGCINANGTSKTLLELVFLGRFGLSGLPQANIAKESCCEMTNRHLARFVKCKVRPPVQPDWSFLLSVSTVSSCKLDVADSITVFELGIGACTETAQTNETSACLFMYSPSTPMPSGALEDSLAS